jgi:hypothetical protein
MKCVTGGVGASTHARQRRTVVKSSLKQVVTTATRNSELAANTPLHPMFASATSPAGSVSNIACRSSA